MITSIVFDVDDTIYDQQAPYRIAVEKCFPDFDMSKINQAYIRFRHYSDVGFPRVMAGEWTTEYFRFWRCKETLLEFGYREIDEATGVHFQEIYEEELENITMLDEMRMTLDFLKEKGVPMGIITNGPTEHQLKKVKNLVFTIMLTLNVSLSAKLLVSKNLKKKSSILLLNNLI
ncbi:2-haloalkanoic acid dehalogenase [Streptococcus sp. HSISB1]|nr:2-haloalkanoic acid dehalogenase [Streptococcus sp. HSISB1]